MNNFDSKKRKRISTENKETNVENKKLKECSQKHNHPYEGLYTLELHGRFEKEFRKNFKENPWGITVKCEECECEFTLLSKFRDEPDRTTPLQQFLCGTKHQHQIDNFHGWNQMIRDGYVYNGCKKLKLCEHDCGGLVFN